MTDDHLSTAFQGRHLKIGVRWAGVGIDLIEMFAYSQRNRLY